MKTRAAALACVAGLAFASFAIADNDPANNTLAGADPITIAHMEAQVRVANLVPGGDVDFFSTFLLTADVFTVITTPLASLPANFGGPDTVLGVFGTGGALATTNDDAGADGVGGGGVGPVRGSVMRLRAFGSGPYGVAVSGFPDFAFGGAHVVTGAYAMTYSRIPVGAPVGGDFADSPGNSTPAGADPILIGPGGAAVAVAELAGIAGGPADVDFFSIFLNAGDILTAVTSPLDSVSTADTRLGVFGVGGVLLFSNDDAGTDTDGIGSLGPVRGSAVRYAATAPGLYYLGVTGFSDGQFTGSHNITGRYGLTVSVVPAPGTVGLLGIAGLLAVRRRR